VNATEGIVLITLGVLIFSDGIAEIIRAIRGEPRREELAPDEDERD
jgi:hypothetical protein